MDRGIYLLNPPTLTDGGQQQPLLDSAGYVKVNVAAGNASATEYTEDVASVADPVGGMLIARRRDTLVTNEVSATGDNIALNATNKGQLHVRASDLEALLPTALAANGGIKIEGVAGGVAVPVSGTFYQATQPVSGTFWQATQPVSGTFWQATQPVSIAGTVATTGPLTNTQLRAEAVDVQDATVGNAVLAELNGATATSRILSAAATTNATSAKASAGSVRTVSGYNAAATPRYLKFYDKASAPTVGTDTPRKTVYLPALSAFCLDFRDYYATGIAYALTTGGADADTGALTAGDILGLNVDYV